MLSFKTLIGFYFVNAKLYKIRRLLSFFRFQASAGRGTAEYLHLNLKSQDAHFDVSGSKFSAVIFSAVSTARFIAS
jgi:hypothetical protein